LARKILLADDSVTAQNMGRRILSDAGYDVTTVNNGSAALKKIAESKPDLIVLDVYMPGYGGLEVCQRLREAPETARIPVLLTVGKLEPFKADEARRVRADGFIVKPFEASELLTALTKLEDKIVPQSQPAKPSRFAKALAAVDEFTPGKEYGDRETGWKNRLPSPPPHSKPRQSAPEEPQAPAANAHETARAEETAAPEMKSGLEEALLSSMPQDVTAEEIAAIKAAAAAFNSPGHESGFRQRPGEQAEAPTEAADVRAEEKPSESVVIENISDATPAESFATAEPPTIVEPASVDVPAEMPPTMTVSESRCGTESQDAENGKLDDDEVTAALASLAPANGHGETAATDRERVADKWDRASRDQVPVTMAVAGAMQEFSGPRWIAEPVALTPDEATFVLEQEMEKAYAAFAAADAARMSFASSLEPEASMQLSDAATDSGANSFPASHSEGFESRPQEPIAISNEESAAQLSAVTHSPRADAVSGSTISEVEEVSAYAAAASASSGMTEAPNDGPVMSQPSPVMESSESVSPNTEPSPGPGESELSAAWANWKNMRESVIGSPPGSNIADTVAELKETASEAQPEPQLDASSATEDDSTEISSIVDSVLADLKPKLMAEIARKMGKEKKK
jgi:CheY-like chemotaxis protein